MVLTGILESEEVYLRELDALLMVNTQEKSQDVLSTPLILLPKLYCKVDNFLLF